MSISISPGARLGPYEIIGAIGAGGMGEVFRAHDAKLNRDVAIKVLPAAFAQDHERVARFKREAQLLASLNHPNIAAIYGLEEADALALVLELVEGEDLSQRLKRGAIPVDEAIAIARQIAEALEDAHEHGIIHRDLKPANIKVTSDGKVKVLDFGLAKAFDNEAGTNSSSADVSHSPTISRHATEAGMIMGTAAYMSPEQARGKTVDKRADIWSFGVVVFEMLTGERLFSGETVSDVLAAVLTREPDWSRLPASVPAGLQTLLRRCLERNPKKRLRDIGEAGLALAEPWPATHSTPTVPRSRENRGSLLRALTALAAVLVVGVFLGRSQASRTAAPAPSAPPVTRTVIDLPPEAPLALGTRVPTLGYDSTLIALSPDGRYLAYVGEGAGGVTRLFLRALGGLEVKPVQGSEGAVSPFFSPDSRWLGFLTVDKVKKVAIDGGSPLTLSNARTSTRANWGSDDQIYVGEDEAAILSQVSASGGELREAARFLRLEFGQFLAGSGLALLSHIGPRSISGDYSSIEGATLNPVNRKTLLEQGFSPRYFAPDQILFVRAGNLHSVSFDASRRQVSGEPAIVAEGVSAGSLFGHAQVAVSDNGMIAYVPGSDRSVGKLAWVDRSGGVEWLSAPERIYGAIALSFDGTRVAIPVADVTDYIWIYDLIRHEGRKISAGGSAGWPVWWPDGQSLVATRFGTEEPGLYRFSAGDGGAAPKLLWPDKASLRSGGMSKDGSKILVRVADTGSGQLGLLSTAAGGHLERLPIPGNIGTPALSPDGRYAAYTSDESGQNEVWVRSLSGEGGATQISVDGALEALWLKDQLFYRKGRQWFAAKFTEVKSKLVFQSPKLVFETDFVDTPGRSYAVSPDGQRLLVVKNAHEPIRNKIMIVQNWRKAPEANSK